jgi:hypothetical protein
MKIALLAAATAAALIGASSAAAMVTINVGPGALQPDENLLFNNNPAPGLTIEGITNQSNTLVSITGGETLVAAGGQARLDTADGTINSNFTFEGLANQFVGFDLSNAGLAFTSTEFRLFGGTATQATLTFVDTAGEVFQQTLNIAPNGFFSALATDGQLIDYFSIAANGTIGDIRQIRVGGVQAIPGGGGGNEVPEPATWAMMIMGFGGVGAMMRRRRLTLA